MSRFCVLMILGALSLAVGCGGDAVSSGIANARKSNDVNVYKVRTCFAIYESRTGRWPKNEEELLEFLKGGLVDRNLETLGIDVSELDEMFVSDRDGQPLKIRWGAKLNPEKLGPIAFEEVGVDGVRLVAADVLLEVDSDEQYDDLWEGNYESKYWSDEDE